MAVAASLAVMVSRGETLPCGVALTAGWWAVSDVEVGVEGVRVGVCETGFPVQFHCPVDQCCS